MYQGIFIDEQKADKHFASLMSTPGKNGLKVKLQQPSELITLANHIKSARFRGIKLPATNAAKCLQS